MERWTELEALTIRPYQAVSAADTDEWWQGPRRGMVVRQKRHDPTPTPPERRKQ